MGRWMITTNMSIFSMIVAELYSSHTQVNPQASCSGPAMQLLHRLKPLLLLLLLLKLGYHVSSAALDAGCRTMHPYALVTLST